MRILIVSQYFWPENFRINDFAQWATQEGHDITVLTGIPNYPAGQFFEGYGPLSNLRETHQGISIKRVPLCPRLNGGKVALILNYLSFAFTASLAGPIVCGRDYDAIFVYEPSPITVGLPAAVMKWWSKTPIIFWVLDLWPESLSATNAVRSPWILKLVSRLVKVIYHSCDRILVQSQAFVKNVKEYGIEENIIEYFPSWAENQYVPGTGNSELLKELELPEGFYVLFTGNIGAAQDFESILSAAEALKTNDMIHWLIVGDGRKYDWVRNEVVRRGLDSNFHIPGRFPLEKMPEFLGFADATLVSLKREPIFALTIPGKFQSYLACGKPVIGMIEGETARIINEAEAGISCPAEDSESLSRAVLSLYSMTSEERSKLGENGRKYYETHFDRTMLFTRLEQIINDTVKKNDY